jgi:hypothetical protein
VDAAEGFARRLVLAGVPAPERELRFGAEAAGGGGKGLRARLAAAGMRDWRFDLAWPDQMLACEVDGGTWTNGGHSRGKHIESDCEKYCAAVTLGWRVMRVTPDMVKDGRALRWVERAMRITGRRA